MNKCILQWVDEWNSDVDKEKGIRRKFGNAAGFRVSVDFVIQEWRYNVEG